MSKITLVILGVLILAILFVPFVPNDSADSCKGTDECDDTVGYTSVYEKYTR
jgi:hypothetical protein